MKKKEMSKVESALAEAERLERQRIEFERRQHQARILYNTDGERALDTPRGWLDKR